MVLSTQYGAIDYFALIKQSYHLAEYRLSEKNSTFAHS